VNNLDPYEAFAQYLTRGFEALGASFRPVVPQDLKGQYFVIKKTGHLSIGEAPSSAPKPNQKAFEDFNSQVTCHIAMLPALLAVKLGYGNEVVQELMLINDANIRDVGMQFSEYNHFTGMMVDVEGRNLRSKDVEHRLCEVIAGSEKLSEKAQEILATENGFSSVAYQMMFFDNKELWPATRIAAQLESKNTTNLAVYKDFYDAEGSQDVPNRSYDDLFARLGVTIPAVVNSKYFKPMFFEDLIERAYRQDEFAAEIIEYGLTHRDQTIQKAFARGIAYALVFEVERFDEDDVEHVLALITNELEGAKLPVYGRSLVTELNLLPVGFDPDDDELDPNIYPGLCNRTTIVKRLITELMSTEPGDVAFGQFHALGTLSRLRLPEQDISGIDHSKAIHYLLAAYNAFTDSDPQLKNHQDIAHLHKCVHDCLETFLTILPKDQFSYEGLEGLSQDKILMLATAGFDMFKLPKMELPTLGRHFTNELGI
jgi:hypothetical protein